MGYATLYDPDTDVDRWYTDATAASLTNWVRPGDRVLELGCATGRMTAALVGAGATVTAVDRESEYLDRAEARGLAGVHWVRADIEPALLASLAGGWPEQFDHVVLANVVHELDDPVGTMASLTPALAPAGLLHVSLQNPSSLHRLVGFATGAIDVLRAISERGERFETRRLYDLFELRALCRRAGLREVHHEGVMLKPLPNAALGELDDSTMDGFVAAGRYLSELAAMHYLILRSADGGR